MATVHHPAFPEITNEVYGEKLDEHLRCGWILIPEPEPEVVPDPVPVVQHIEPEPEPLPDPDLEDPGIPERRPRRRNR